MRTLHPFILFVSMFVAAGSAYGMNDTDALVAGGVFPFPPGNSALHLLAERTETALRQDVLTVKKSYQFKADKTRRFEFGMLVDRACEYRVWAEEKAVPVQMKTGRLRDKGDKVEVQKISADEIMECEEFNDGDICSSDWAEFSVIAKMGETKSLLSEMTCSGSYQSAVRRYASELFLYSEKFWAGRTIPSVDFEVKLDEYKGYMDFFEPEMQDLSYLPGMSDPVFEKGEAGFKFRFSGYAPRKQPGTYAAHFGVTDSIDPVSQVIDAVYVGGEKMPGELSSDVLLRALDDKRWWIRLYAIEELGKRGEARAADRMLSLAASDDGVFRLKAVQALGTMKDKRAVPPLRALLNTAQDDGLRFACLEALASLRPEALSSMLLPLMNDKNVKIRLKAMEAAGQARNDLLFDAVLAALADSDESIRSKAIEVLGRRRHPKAALPLWKALADSDPRFRGKAAEALSRYGTDLGLHLKHEGIAPEELAKQVKAYFRDEQWSVRAACLKIAGSLRLPGIYEDLIQGLQDRHYRVRANAAEALGSYGEVRAVEPLIAAFKKDYSMADSAGHALFTLTGQSFGDDYREWESWWRQNKSSYDAGPGNPEAGR